MLRATIRLSTTKGCAVGIAGDAASSSFAAALAARKASSVRTTAASLSADSVAPAIVDMRQPRLRYGLPPAELALRRRSPPAHVHWLGTASDSARSAPAAADSQASAWPGSSLSAIRRPPIVI